MVFLAFLAFYAGAFYLHPTAAKLAQTMNGFFDLRVQVQVALPALIAVLGTLALQETSRMYLQGLVPALLRPDGARAHGRTAGGAQ